MSSPAITRRLWHFAGILRADGMSYGDYLEQLTYLLFLKMADERTRAPFNEESAVPAKYAWPALLARDGEELFSHYSRALESLGKKPGLLGLIFRGALNKFQNPAKLRRVIAELIDAENWSALSADVKGDAYEGLLQKNAGDVKTGAGQYFTPRPLIAAIVECVAPRPGETINDPACGTGGFFLAARDYLVARNPNISRSEKRRLRDATFYGQELVPGAARLCAMNLMLHGIGGGASPVTIADSLVAKPDKHFDIVMTNPPFGAGDGSVPRRDDFWADTANSQLNFVQHIRALLKEKGRAAVVVPDNVLFEGGAGEAVRRNLLASCDVHTLLRLPTGIFYAQGVKANVLFFDKKPASKTPWTKTLWIYDLRTDKRFTLKTNPLTPADLEEFVACYNPKNRFIRKPGKRWRAFDFAELTARDKANLDIFWREESAADNAKKTPPPAKLAAGIVADLEVALKEMRALRKDLARK